MRLAIRLFQRCFSLNRFRPEQTFGELGVASGLSAQRAFPQDAVNFRLPPFAKVAACGPEPPFA